MFLEITGTKSYSFSDLDGRRQFSCQNHNAFLNMMEGAISGKTKFTAKAGYCYVGALQDHDRTFVVALLACGWPGNKTYKWKDTRKLMTYGMENYEYREFHQVPIKTLQGIPVLQAQTDKIGRQEMIIPCIEDRQPDKNGILMKQDETIEVIYDIKKELTAPVERKEQIGTIKLQLNHEICKEYFVYTDKEVLKIDYPWCLRMVWNSFSI